MHRTVRYHIRPIRKRRPGAGNNFAQLAPEKFVSHTHTHTKTTGAAFLRCNAGWSNHRSKTDDKQQRVEKKENICPVVSVGRDRRDKLPLNKEGKGKKRSKKVPTQPTNTHTHPYTHTQQGLPNHGWLILQPSFRLPSRQAHGANGGLPTDAGRMLVVPSKLDASQSATRPLPVRTTTLN